MSSRQLSTICPAPITPRRLTSRAAATGLELKHLEWRADRKACLRRIWVIILLGREKEFEER
jgi:hypothetical protein